jgi:cell division protein FtsB
MRRFKKPGIVQKIFFNQISFALLGLIVLGAIGYPLAKNVGKRYDVNNEIKELETEIGGIENKNLELKNLIDYLDSDQFAEEQARLNLNYRQEGEEVVVIENGQQPQNNAAGANITSYSISGMDKTAPPPVKNNPVRWWEYFSSSF